MANKEIICVYQDCPLCGSRGKTVLDLATNNGVAIRKVSFASDEGKDLIYKALTKHKIGTMPFFTDGEQFATNLEDFFKKREKKTTKKSQKREKKEVESELDQ